MATKKKKIEINAKVEDNSTPTTLEQVWGFNESARFGTSNREEFNKTLNEMNRPELEAFARKKGVMVVEDTVRLRANILKEFDFFLSSLRKPKNTIKATEKEKLDAEVKRILAEGR